MRGAKVDVYGNPADLRATSAADLQAANHDVCTGLCGATSAPDGAFPRVLAPQPRLAVFEPRRPDGSVAQ